MQLLSESVELIEMMYKTNFIVLVLSAARHKVRHSNKRVCASNLLGPLTRINMAPRRMNSPRESPQPPTHSSAAKASRVTSTR